MQQQTREFPSEIFLLISNNLEQDDLLRCVLVSKAWNEVFTPALFVNICVSQAGFITFLSPGIIQKAAKHSKLIQSIDVPHPTFARPLLNAVAVTTSDLHQHYFPKLRSISIMFDENYRRTHRLKVPQPQFFYPSDNEDISGDEDDMDYEKDQGTSDFTVENPAKDVYSDLVAPFLRARDTAYLSQDPNDIIRLVRQCPSLCSLKIQVRGLGNMGGLNHLVWPGVLPQSLERLEIVVPEHWNEESYDNSEDEDYDPSLYPMRDVAEEFEEDDDEEEQQEENSKADTSQDYDEDEVVTWYRAQLPDLGLDNSFGNFWETYNDDVPMQPLLNLHELAVENAEVVRHTVLNFIIHRCPHLRTVQLINPSGHFCKNLRFSHGKLPRELRELRIEIKNDSEYFDEEYFSCALGSAQWRSIILKDYCMLYAPMASSLLDLAPTMEILDLGNNAGSLVSQDIHRLLTTAPELKLFSGKALYFLAQIAARQNWVCAGTLKTLRCQILLEVPLVDSSIEPPRPEGTISDEEQEIMSLSNNELQQRVMAQLGRCHQLQELDLSHFKADGYVLRSPYGHVISVVGLMVAPRAGNANVRLPWTMDNQSKCLEFTFETGLRELGMLSSLRKLNLTGLRHRISVDELKWMKEAWPRLEEFGGLLSGDMDFEDDVYEDRENRRAREEEIRQWLQDGEVTIGDRTFWGTLKA
ncbi:hypothetical protein BGX27_001892 [Mortierella sp. AM989]|nr:hypothetical protein BGX27_001892 [Mortierella sp. AM989]